MMTDNILLEKAKKLKLYGLIEHWEEATESITIEQLLVWEESVRMQRSLERRIRAADIGRFKSLNEFNWQWPTSCDRELIEECMQLNFIKTNRNIILCGPNGVGKTMIVKNIAYNAVLQGHTALFTTAGLLLNDLASQDGDNALRRRIQHYVRPALLIIDEVGYLSYSNRHADLLFEVISRRYQEKPSIITTNKIFSEWTDIFPNASCVVSLIDRLVHNAEIIPIEAESYRLKESKEQIKEREALRAKNREKEK